MFHASSTASGLDYRGRPEVSTSGRPVSRCGNSPGIPGRTTGTAQAHSSSIDIPFKGVSRCDILSRIQVESFRIYAKLPFEQ
ncbi:hypothetical protein MTO96_028303, partial [Rhipicephalus appendiculatus]